MKYRKLRIAWSVAWGIAGLLLFALWVRSYWWLDALVVPRSAGRSLGVVSDYGTLAAGDADSTFMGAAWPVGFSSARTATNESGGFAFHSEPREQYVRSPHWFVVLIAVALTANPWIPWRFSLRTLLIAMTVAAIGLGLVVYLSR